MKIGNSVRVKDGIISPDYNDLIIGGWQGRITEINDDIVSIELDSITLTKLSSDYIVNSIVEEVEFSIIMLNSNEVSIVEPRDTPQDVVRVKTNIERRFSPEDEENRISEILKTNDESVNEVNLKTYFKYLKSKVSNHCILTGTEDFPWEEPYLFGDWDNDEYEKLKITQPSYTDHYKLVNFIDKFAGRQGIIVKVERLSDKKVFELPLWDLEVVDNNAPEYILISDYSSWMTNY
jgi:hypothetical protein